MTAIRKSMARKVDAILFDKDGTLFDFHATWSGWAADIIRDLSGGEAATMARIASEIGFDLAVGQFRPESPMIAGTNREGAECVARALPGRDVDEIEHLLMLSAAEAAPAPAVPLAELLEP